MKRGRNVPCYIYESQYQFIKEMGLSPSELLRAAITARQSHEKFMRGANLNERR